ncbi:MAG: leucine-rich repeat domain-containing protein [Lachnospiraceae bacterium]|nr:leucine-rich repeat domain-containing protein [Lachnospiraceae bacterium]
MDATSLTGVLDLSNTQVTNIGMNAFRRSGLTGVILPKILKNIGEEEKDN